MYYPYERIFFNFVKTYFFEILFWSDFAAMFFSNCRISSHTHRYKPFWNTSRRTWYLQLSESSHYSGVIVLSDSSASFGAFARVTATVFNVGGDLAPTITLNCYNSSY